MPYVPNATDSSQPTGSQTVASAAPEFRTLKSYVSGFNSQLDGFQFQLDSILAGIGAGDNSAALAAALGSNTGTSLIGYKYAATGSVFRSLTAELSDYYISVKRFGAVGNGIVDDTLAFNTAFEAARVQGKCVFVPAGTYMCTNLLFGTNTVGSQSSAPLGIIGEGYSSVIKSITASTGTLFKAQNTAGVNFSEIALDGNGTAQVLLDTSWTVGVGPSQQNVYDRLRLSNSSASTIWSALNNNDSHFTRCVINANINSQCCLDLTASGGLVYIDNCIWNNGYLKFGCQNGTITNSWGMGILFSQGCINYISLIGLYLYPNLYLGSILKSESFASFQSVRGLTAIACQFIGSAGLTSFFDLNLFSNADFYSCQFTGASATVDMWGPNSRSDGFSVVKVLYRGGSAVIDDIHLNDPTGFISEARGLVHEQTSTNYDKNWGGNVQVSVSGQTTAGTATYSNRTLKFIREGNLVHFNGRVSWSAATGTGALQITGLPYAAVQSTGGQLSYPGSTFSGNAVYVDISGTTITFNTLGGPKFGVVATGDVIISGTYLAQAV